MRHLLLALALVGFGTPAWAGGGWVRPARTAYVSVSYSTLTSHEYYSLNGERRDRGSEFSQRSVDLYSEYGLTDHFTAELGVPAVRRLAFESTEASTGLGDIRLGVKVGSTIAGNAVAGSVTAELPTGRESAPAKFRNDPESHINLPRGDGELNLWSRLAVSRSHPKRPIYASIDGGYNLRTEGYSDQYDFNLELGGKIADPLWIRGRLRGLYSVDAKPGRDLSFVYGEGTEYLELGVGSELRIAHPFSIGFNYANVFEHRRNVYGGGRWSTGVAAQL